MKRKQKNTYLPLLWCHHIKKQMHDVIGIDINPYDVFTMVNSLLSVQNHKIDDVLLNTHLRNIALAKIEDFQKKYPIIQGVLYAVRSIEYNPDRQTMAMIVAAMNELNSAANILCWTENKQCFKFDKTFLQNLLKTRNMTIVKDEWRYLPFKSFYIDISDDKDLCRDTLCEGYFVTVQNTNEKCLYQEDDGSFIELDNMWIIHVTKVNHEDQFCLHMTVPNADFECEPDAETEAVLTSYRHDRIEHRTDTVMNLQIDQLLITQILNYLVSVEPDVQETEESKTMHPNKPAESSSPDIDTPETGHPISTTKKDRYQEIRSWDVGVRYGAAVRKWQQEKENNAPASSGANGSHTKKRPHSRSAHWSHYWYGHGNQKIKRRKWIDEIHINFQHAKTELPAVIRKCGIETTQSAEEI